MKYERINGKLYMEVDEATLMSKLADVKASIAAYTDGIKTCDNNIAAYELQKKKYQMEIDDLLINTGLDKETFRQLSPEKAAELGF